MFTGAGLRRRPLPQAKALTEPAGETVDAAGRLKGASRKVPSANRNNSSVMLTHDSSLYTKEPVDTVAVGSHVRAFLPTAAAQTKNEILSELCMNNSKENLFLV